MHQTECFRYQVIRDDTSKFIDHMIIDRVIRTMKPLTRLKQTNSPPQIPSSHLKNPPKHRLPNQNPFSPDNIPKLPKPILAIHGLESEFGTTRGEGIDDPTDVVADEAEPGVAGIGFDDSAKGCLGIICERVGFIQNDQLKRRTRVPGNFFISSDLGEEFHLFSDNGDAALVRCIQFQDSVSKEDGAPEITG